MIKIRVLREAGGLGDVVRTLPVLKGFKEKYPGCVIHYFGLEYYRPIIEGSIDCDKYISLTREERRPRDAEANEDLYPYLKKEGPYDVTVDLFCPALKHEIDTGGAVTKDRIELFCEAANVNPSIMRPELPERNWDNDWVESVWKKSGLNNQKVVGLQPFSTSILRNWPLPKWITLSRELSKRGWKVLVFDSHRQRSSSVAGLKCTGLPLVKVLPLMKKCDLMITPDSGLFHVAGAMEVPLIGLFGCTNGEVMTKYYPTANHYTLDSYKPDCGCRPPCYVRRERKYSPPCGEKGCEIMEKIFVWQILNKVAEVIDHAKV